MNKIFAAINQEVRPLPPRLLREPLNFIRYLRLKYAHQSDPGWLDRAWGIAPDFPDRPTQPTIKNIQEL